MRLRRLIRGLPPDRLETGPTIADGRFSVLCSLFSLLQIAQTPKLLRAFLTVFRSRLPLSACAPLVPKHPDALVPSLTVLGPAKPVLRSPISPLGI